MIQGSNTTVSAVRQTSTNIITLLGYSEALYRLSLGEMLIYAKSGYVRTILNSINCDVNGTTIGYLLQYGQSWNNTADNLTSLVILADQANGLGIGTEITLERLNL
jgi:hypothetical protein